MTNYYKIVDIFAEHRAGLIPIISDLPYYEFQEYIDILKERLEQRKQNQENEEKKVSSGSFDKDIKKYNQNLPKFNTKIPSFKPPKF